MMTGTEFAKAFAQKGLSAWEAAAVGLARSGELLIPPFLPVPVSDPVGTLKGTVLVTSDVVSVGTPHDLLRIPLTPGAAQAVADASGGALLPTRKIVKDAWAVATKKMTPHPLVPNKGADMAQYLEHSLAIDLELENVGYEFGEMVSGDKKDVVLSNAITPGKVVIYGWIKPDGSAIQPLSNVHGDFYVDYSHGVHLVSPSMQVEGIGTVPTESVLRDPHLSTLVSDEGPLRAVRYPSTKVAPLPELFPAGFTRTLMLGLTTLVYYAERSRRA